MEATRTYWLSFSDGRRPEGDQFLGVVVVDVDSEVLADTPPLPAHIIDPEARWLAAAIRETWRAKVNPGGGVLSHRLDDLPSFSTVHAVYPRLTLLSRADIAAYDERVQAVEDVHTKPR